MFLVVVIGFSNPDISLQFLFVNNAHSCQTGGQSHRRDDANALELRINKYVTISTEIPPTALKGLGYQLQYSHVRVH